MTNKKWLMAATVLLIAVLAFVGCGGSGGGAEGKAATKLHNALQAGYMESLQKILDEAGPEVFAALTTASASPGGDFAYELNRDKDGIITGYTGSGGVVIVPSEIEGYPLKAIGYRTFARSYTSGSGSSTQRDTIPQ